LSINSTILESYEQWSEYPKVEYNKLTSTKNQHKVGKEKSEIAHVDGTNVKHNDSTLHMRLDFLKKSSLLKANVGKTGSPCFVCRDSA